MAKEPIQCFFLEVTHETVTEGNRTSPLYRRTDTGETGLLADFPAGAMWFGDWYPDSMFNPQLGPGKTLIVRTPGGDWVIDQQANNCTIPGDYSQAEHHCWVIHGTPPTITVDKDGVTCKAGGGSIAQKNWHGFLRNGFLLEC
jgi:hypothetical protein